MASCDAPGKAWDGRWMPHYYNTHHNAQPDANPCSTINKGQNHNSGRMSFQTTTRCISTTHSTILAHQGLLTNTFSNNGIRRSKLTFQIIKFLSLIFVVFFQPLKCLQLEYSTWPRTPLSPRHTLQVP